MLIGLILSLISGIAWTVVYITTIRISFKEKTYGMPLIALALNFGWELLYTILGFSSGATNVQSWVNLIWCGLDIVMVYTYFKYGRKDFEQYAEPKYFASWSVLIFVVMFILQVGFALHFGKAEAPYLSEMSWFVETHLGCWYAAFIQNFIMSILYINMLALRKSTRGQSMVIAVCKWIGTLTPTILYGVIFANHLVLILGIFCSVFDLIYIGLVKQYQKLELQVGM